MAVRVGVEVNRLGGELGRRVQGLRDSTRGLMEDLRQVEPQVAAAMRTLQAYQEMVRRGGELTREQVDAQHRMTQYLQTTGVANLRQKAAEGGPESRRAAYLAQWVQAQTAEPVVPRETAPAADPARRSETVSPTKPPVQEPAPAPVPPPEQPIPAAAPPRPSALVPPKPPTPVGDDLAALTDQALAERRRQLDEEIRRAERDIGRVTGYVPGAVGQDEAGDEQRRRLHEQLSEADPVLQRLHARRAQLDAEQQRREGAPEAAGAPLPPSGVAVGGTPGQGAADAATAGLRRDGGREGAGVDRLTDNLERLRRQKQLHRLTDRELGDEWRKVNDALGKQDRVVERLANRYSKFTGLERRGMLGCRERVELEEGFDNDLRPLKARLDEARAASEVLRQQRADMQTVAQDRGMRADGSRLVPTESASGGKGLRGAAGAFLAGAGFGSGSIVGTVAGAALGGLSISGAIATIAGMFVGKAINYGIAAYAKDIEATGRIMPLALATGVHSNTILRSDLDAAERFKVGLPEITDTRHRLGFGIGRTEIEPTMAVARLTGQTGPEEAQRVVALSRFSSRHDPYMSVRMLEAYGRSALARPQTPVAPLRPGQAGPPPPPERALPYETLLYRPFAEAVGRLAQAESSPFTRVPVEGVAEQLRRATQLKIPGVEMGTIGGLDVASNLIAMTNRMASGQQSGTLGDLQMMSIYRLRGSEIAKELRKDEYGNIDINTIAGMRRLRARAPEIAARLPGQMGEQLMGSMIGEPRRYIRPDVLELMLQQQYGEEGGHLLATRPVGELAGLYRGLPPKGEGRGATERDIIAAAERTAERSDVDRFWQFTQRPDIEMIRTSVDALQKLGADEIIKWREGMIRTLREELVAFFNAPAEPPSSIPGMSGSTPERVMQFPEMTPYGTVEGGYGVLRR